MTVVEPNLRATRTTCPYCGVGCGVLATPDGSGGAGISGDPEHPANAGRLCLKGSALGETLGVDGRLLTPRVLGQDTDWSTALGTVADGSTSAVYSNVLTNSTASPVTLAFTTVTAPYSVVENTCPAGYFVSSSEACSAMSSP